MELKPRTGWRRWTKKKLLIVLNGIETKVIDSVLAFLLLLLIVLNGIETKTGSTSEERLIILLIVLNGIETWDRAAGTVRQDTFNRTKWNWNVFRTGLPFYFLYLLIVLNGIETWARRTLPMWRILLIVLNGIETDSGLKPLQVAGEPFNRTKWNWNNAMKGTKYITNGF